ncbi:MAG: hypothetical protein KKF62_17975 [Bacteroidetes bacterium]|nr:hypothetical protein [Bacteroidota bacterium]MBU1115319.1 hypothetical protein [Bacteroidota bacterium]MBU1800361.1 hypothetical protein [Bacteroidota bacterium]
MNKLFAKLIFTSLLLPLILFQNNISAQVVDSSSYPPNSYEKIQAINFKNIDIKDLLRGLALEYKTNIVIENKINQNVSVALFDVNVYQAVEMIAKDNGLIFSFDKNRFYLKTPEEKGPAPKMEKEPYVAYHPDTDKIDLVLDDVLLSTLAQKLRDETKLNFLISNGSSGRVSGTLTNVNTIIGLRNVLQNSGFYIHLVDSIYYITRSAYYSSDNGSEQNKSQYWVSVKNNKVTLDVKDGDVDKVIEDIVIQSNLQMIKLAPATAKVTVKCASVPLEKALYYILKNTGYSYKMDGDVFIFGKAIDKEIEDVKLIRLKYLKAELVYKKLPKLFGTQLSIEVSPEHNALIVKGDLDNIIELGEYIEEIDHPVPQVLIEALVVDYNIDDIYDFGITAGIGDSTTASRKDQWLPGLDVTASGKKLNNLLNDIGTVNLFGTDVNIGNLGQLPDNFYVNIRALEENGLANVKSRPILSTLNGNKASLSIGTTQNYVFTDVMPIQNQISSSYIQQERIQKIEASISFEITPWVGPNNQLTLEISPDFQTPVGEFSPDKNLIPAINTRKLESTIRLNDGETIVIGGLIQEIESETQSKIPILGDIPWLGKLFTSTHKQTKKSEMLIYVTPHIFYEQEAGYAHFNYSEEEL